MQCAPRSAIPFDSWMHRFGARRKRLCASSRRWTVQWSNWIPNGIAPFKWHGCWSCSRSRSSVFDFPARGAAPINSLGKIVSFNQVLCAPLQYASHANVGFGTHYQYNTSQQLWCTVGFLPTTELFLPLFRHPFLAEIIPLQKKFASPASFFSMQQQKFSSTSFHCLQWCKIVCSMARTLALPTFLLVWMYLLRCVCSYGLPCRLDCINTTTKIAKIGRTSKWKNGFLLINEGS